MLFAAGECAAAPRFALAAGAIVCVNTGTVSPPEKELRAAFARLRHPATAHCKFTKPPQPHEVCEWVLCYKGVVVRTYFAQRADKSDLVQEFLKTAGEKGLLLR